MQDVGAGVSLAVRPDHVPPSLQVDFNMYNVPGGVTDAQAAFHAVQLSSPDIFWTPHNGGHWVATRAEDVEMILRDPARFSSKRVFLPRDDTAPRSLPLETDPPLHTELRKPLSRALFPKIVDEMEPRVRQLVDDLIDQLIDQGECDFVADFANIMPMNIFLDLVDLPREERHRLLPLVEKFIKGGTLEARQEAQQAIFVYVTDIVRARRANPGSDLASIVVNATVGEGMISETDAISYMTLILFGGLDTIAAMLSYIMLFLATHPEHRAILIERLDDDRFVRDAMEELFRRFGIVQAARVVQEDFNYKGVLFRQNDTILPINMLCGLDDRRIDSPLDVRFDRERPARHLAFGAGPHSCPGATLARREIGIFLREWLRRIPDFSLKPGTRPTNLLGVTCGLEELELVWPTAGDKSSS